MARAFTLGAGRQGSNPRPNRAGNLNSSTLVSALPDAWRYGVSAWISWPNAGLQWLGEAAGLVCDICLSEAAPQMASADPSLWYSLIAAGMLSNQETTKTSTTTTTTTTTTTNQQEKRARGDWSQKDL